jgi:hypothetical protein
MEAWSVSIIVNNRDTSVLQMAETHLPAVALRLKIGKLWKWF